MNLGAPVAIGFWALIGAAGAVEALRCARDWLDRREHDFQRAYARAYTGEGRARLELYPTCRREVMAVPANETPATLATPGGVTGGDDSDDRKE